MGKRPSIVVLGGGTGTYMMLLALKTLPVDITAILTMVDDGGSNRILRDQFGLLPTSGICQAISALSDEESVLRELFNYRFHQGEGISGMRFGNLFLAAVTDIMGTQKAGIAETLRLLKVRGNIFPVSYDDVRLVAEYEDGHQVVGEHMIDEPTHDGTLHITRLWTQPEAMLSEESRQAILESDFVVFGPGDFYTNTIANFVVKGLPEAMHETKATTIFVSNLMTKYGETYNFTLTNFLEELQRYFPLEDLDAVVVNSNMQYSSEALQLYAQDSSIPVHDDVSDGQFGSLRVVRGDIVADSVFAKQKADVLQRSILRHDPQKFAQLFASAFLSEKAVS